MVNSDDIIKVAGEMAFMEGLDTGLWRLIDSAADFKTNAMAGLEKMPRGYDLDGEFIDFPRYQALGVSVRVKRLPRL